MTVPVRDAVPRTARWFVRLFLAVFVVCAIAGVEAWPFTGFRLFSRLRHETQGQYVAYTVANGAQTRLWFSELPRPYQGFDLVMIGFSRLPAARRRAACEAWLAEARRLRPATTELRVYHEEVSALPRRGTRAGPATGVRLIDACS